MGFIQAFKGALGGTFADQWKEYMVPMTGYTQTSALIPAVPVGTNNGRGANTKGSFGIISNGSKIIIPKDWALVTVQDGAVTGCITEPGGYTFSTTDPNAKSIFSGDGLISSLISQSWERFKFGGIPSSQQYAIYINMAPISDLNFGTQSEIYWDDAFLGTQVGALTRGNYELKIINPIVFLNWVGVANAMNGEIFDFNDMDNQKAEALFRDVVGCLAPAFSRYTNDPSKGNRITKIQGDSIGFADSLRAAIEEERHWKDKYGIEITSANILSIEYDEDTRALLSDVKKADSLSGARGNSFMQQSAARGIEAAGKTAGGAGMAFMGMGMNAANGMMGAMQQPNTPSMYQNSFANAQPAQQPMPNEDPTEKLLNAKKLLDAGAITQEDYDKIKTQTLGI